MGRTAILAQLEKSGKDLLDRFDEYRVEYRDYVEAGEVALTLSRRGDNTAERAGYVALKHLRNVERMSVILPRSASVFEQSLSALEAYLNNRKPQPQKKAFIDKLTEPLKKAVASAGGKKPNNAPPVFKDWKNAWNECWAQQEYEAGMQWLKNARTALAALKKTVNE
jgi:hypothetical protein